MIVAVVSGARALDPRFYRAHGREVPPYVARAGAQAPEIVATFVRRAHAKAAELGEAFVFAAGECEYSADAWGLETCTALGADFRVYTVEGEILGRERGAAVEARWRPPGGTNPLRRNDALAQFAADRGRGGDIVVFGAFSATWARTKGTAYTAREVLQRSRGCPRLRAWVWEFDEERAGASSRRIDGWRRGGLNG